jgi:cyclophilin family peptidyl-prolyl cis-trans isomerase
MAKSAVNKKINLSKTCKYATMKFHDGEEESTVFFELFSDICPKTVENFLSLCDGFKNAGDEQIGYKGSEVHRIVNGMYIQLGRIKHSIGFANKFNAEFEDESFCVKHTEIGLLGMCKRSGLKHSNES